MNRHILIGIIYCAIGQVLIWFQTNSQFIWPEVKDYRLLISIVFGTTVSYLFILGVGHLYEGFDSQIWPSRIIPTITGTIIFFVLTCIIKCKFTICANKFQNKIYCWYRHRFERYFIIRIE